MAMHSFMTLAPSRSNRLLRGLLLLIVVGLLAACGRNVTSTPGDAPNL